MVRIAEKPKRNRNQSGTSCSCQVRLMNKRHSRKNNLSSRAAITCYAHVLIVAWVLRSLRTLITGRCIQMFFLPALGQRMKCSYYANSHTFTLNLIATFGLIITLKKKHCRFSRTVFNQHLFSLVWQDIWWNYDLMGFSQQDRMMTVLGQYCTLTVNSWWQCTYSIDSCIDVVGQMGKQMTANVSIKVVLKV